MTADIELSIHQQKRIEIFYEPGVRLVEPHVLGRSTQGNLLLRAYQIEGPSASGEHEHWKMFRVDKISDLTVTDQTFDEPRPQYNPEDKQMKGGIIARL